MHYLSTGAGFLPSTVPRVLLGLWWLCFKNQNNSYLDSNKKLYHELLWNQTNQQTNKQTNKKKQTNRSQQQKSNVQNIFRKKWISRWSNQCFWRWRAISLTFCIGISPTTLGLNIHHVWRCISYWKWQNSQMSSHVGLRGRIIKLKLAMICFFQAALGLHICWCKDSPTCHDLLIVVIDVAYLYFWWNFQPPKWSIVTPVLISRKTY